ncbi:MAG: hypothetical protein F4X12_18685 [Acidobacteriia bacterium]|nr:hypothetical protein [Terriglobia bacterium]
MSGFPDPQALDRQALRRAFNALSRHLGEREIRAHIYVEGGAVMELGGSERHYSGHRHRAERPYRHARTRDV